MIPLYDIRKKILAWNRQVIDISGNSMERSHFTLSVNTDAYFGCSVVYNGETFILGGKKEPNQVISHFNSSKIPFS